MVGLCLLQLLKVLSYWNLNFEDEDTKINTLELKVLSYWNLNVIKNGNSPIT